MLAHESLESHKGGAGHGRACSGALARSGPSNEFRAGPIQSRQQAHELASQVSRLGKDQKLVSVKLLPGLCDSSVGPWMARSLICGTSYNLQVRTGHGMDVRCLPDE